MLAPGIRFRIIRLLALRCWAGLAGLTYFRPRVWRVLINNEFVGLERASCRAALLHHRVKLVFFIHDLLPITHAECFRPRVRDHLILKLQFTLQNSAALIVNSRETLRQLAEHARRAPAPLPTTVTALLAPGFKLVVIGPRRWECENVVDLLERCKPLRGVVVEHSSCTDIELNNCLAHAQALVFQTFAEGYGLPLFVGRRSSPNTRALKAANGHCNSNVCLFRVRTTKQPPRQLS